ncbi:hypothetical protein PV755_09395 [Streptomyces caniscabiei]|nr:hypothetical protein [Streptomyces caniscabiei]MDX3509136.1 hypothetical protein [Streptomyces caniscabiei]MDX3717111.1 hypothetical protein [Streptomyces caniscabiei]WEO22979.1 hypothetical protein IHE65_07330 [Streptomyces caniscabiei]
MTDEQAANLLAQQRIAEAMAAAEAAERAAAEAARLAAQQR